MSEGKRSKRTCSKSLRVVTPQSIGLPPVGHALTSMPEQLQASRAAGAIRIRKSESPYAARAERRGDLRVVVALLLEVRRRARRGESLLDIADASAEGWLAREALSNAAGRPLAGWDSEQWRTQTDRLALVERTLDLYGYVRPRRGGWTVGR